MAERPWEFESPLGHQSERARAAQAVRAFFCPGSGRKWYGKAGDAKRPLSLQELNDDDDEDDDQQQMHEAADRPDERA